MNDVGAQVVFAGAGPGDPGLITVKAALAIGKAEVIICDRLVNKEILDRYAPPNHLLVYAGKKGGDADSLKQADVNKLIEKYVSEKKRVVRLKGGDISIYANLLDELLTVTRLGASFELIPGISAASGASASMGIPLTARDYSRSVRYLTLFDSDDPAFSNPKFTGLKEAASAKETLVFFMTARHVRRLAHLLLANGFSPEMKMAVIERATTAEEQVTCCSLSCFAALDATTRYASPTLVIAGEIIDLYGRFSPGALTAQKTA